LNMLAKYFDNMAVNSAVPSFVKILMSKQPEHSLNSATTPCNPTMSKRPISHLLNDEAASGLDAQVTVESSSRPSRRLKLDASDANSTLHTSLAYPNTSRPTSKQTPFQQPTQILSFSYTPARTLEFTDSALRYFVEPPLGAKLAYGYERWARKPDSRGRIDGLLQAFSKAKDMSGVPLQDVSVVAWRGVMTRYVNRVC